MCIGCSPEDVTYVPIGHGNGGGQDVAEILEMLRPLLESETPTKIIHNAKPALEALHSAGIELRGLAFDTMIAAFLLESGQRSAAQWSAADTQLAAGHRADSSEIHRRADRGGCAVLLR
jgi:DNA polymerase I-like protein with 3'-5' exonuclease and polymerase domains